MSQWGIAAAIQNFNGRAHTGHAAGLLKQKLNKKAEQEAKLGTQLDPYDGYAWFQYGAALYLEEQFAEAVKVLSQGIPVLPHEYNAIRLLGFSQYYIKDIKNAAMNLDDYITMNPAPVVTPGVLFQRAALTNLQLKQHGDCLFLMTKAADKASDKTAMYRVNSAASVLLNFSGTADFYYRMIRFLYPQTAFDPGELVILAQQSNKLPQAVTYLKTVLAMNPNDLSIVQGLAIAHARAGNYADADAIMKDAIAAHPDHSALRIVYGDILHGAKRYNEANKQYDEHLRLEPDSRFRGHIEKKKATPQQ